VHKDAGKLFSGQSGHPGVERVAVVVDKRDVSQVDHGCLLKLDSGAGLVVLSIDG
jgi:hypothetical protein